jgi:hypothetical protein
MKLSPNRDKASQFNLREISVQELKNILYAMEHVNPPWQFNSPWGRGVIQQFKAALAAERLYHQNDW